MVQFVVAVVAALIAQAAIRQADQGVAVCILMKQFVASIFTSAGGTRDLQLVGAFIARILTGEVTVAAPILLDAGCGFIAGFITHATIVAACLVASRRAVRSEVAFEAIDPGTVSGTGRGRGRGHVARNVGWSRRRIAATVIAGSADNVVEGHATCGQT